MLKPSFNSNFADQMDLCAKRFVSHKARGNVSLQIGRFRTAQEKKILRDKVIKHNFVTAK